MRRILGLLLPMSSAALLVLGASCARKSVRRPWPKPGEAKIVRVSTSPVFVDEDTRIRFVVADDLQHISAFAPEGDLLWHKNLVDAVPMRDPKARPTVLLLGQPFEWMGKVMDQRGKSGDYIAVTFNTKACGLVDQRNGEFTFMGND